MSRGFDLKTPEGQEGFAKFFGDRLQDLIKRVEYTRCYKMRTKMNRLR